MPYSICGRFSGIAAATLKGATVEPKPVQRRLDYDRLADVAVAVAVRGAVAVILAVAGFARKEPWRVAISAAGLGVSAIAFQFLTVAVGALLFVILVAAVPGSLGFS